MSYQEVLANCDVLRDNAKRLIQAVAQYMDQPCDENQRVMTAAWFDTDMACAKASMPPHLERRRFEFKAPDPRTL